MITEDYVSFETAKLLKEKEFTHDMFNPYQLYMPNGQLECWNESPNDIYAPTLQMAMKWLREVHNLCLFVIPATIDNTFRAGYALYPQCDNKWEWCASKNDGSKATFGCDINKDYCDSYEQACEAAIKYCLENLIVVSDREICKGVNLY